MATGVLNPVDVTRSTVTRPPVALTGVNERRWYSNSLHTELDEDDLNAILGQFRYAMDFYGVTDVEGDDSMLQKCIQVGAGSLSGNIALFQALSGSADKVAMWTAPTTMTTFTVTSYSRSLLAKTSLGQWQDALGISSIASPNVIAFSALAGGADKLPYFTGIGTMSQTTMTALARSLLDDVLTSDMRTTLGLGTMALADTATYMPKSGGIFTGNIFGGGPATLWTVGVNTVDGFDSSGLVLAGAGANGIGRGASLALFGNEHATLPGQALITAATIDLAGTLINNLKVGGPGSVFSVTQDTVDGTDTGAIVIAGGGAAPDSGRGAYLALYGNEVAGVGGSALLTGSSGITANPGSGVFAVTGQMTVSGALTLASSFLQALNPQNSNYSFASADAGKRVRHNNATPHAYTIVQEASVPMEVGTSIGIMSVAGPVTVTRGASVSLLGAGGVDSDYVVAPNQYAEIVKVDGNLWKMPMGLADQRLMGNVSGASAVATGLTQAQVRTFLALATGDISGLTAALALKADLAGAAFTGAVSFTATPTVSGSTMWHAGNDGAGSGLDADLLDGSNGAAYLARANHTGTQAPATIAMAATSRLLGRITAGAGAAEELTAAQAKTVLAIVPADVTGLGYFATGTDAANLTGTVAAARMAAAQNFITSLQQNTPDGADINVLQLAGGGSSVATRGAFALLYGNENATFPGRLWLSAGATGDVLLQGGGIDLINGTTFSGVGSGLTGLNASNLSTGSIPAARIANGTISLAMQANIAASTILGNNTGGAAAPIALTAAQAKTVLAIASGDVSGLTYFATGTDAANLTGTVASARIAGAYTGFTAITVTSIDASNNAAPVLTLYRNSASPAAADLLGQLVFSGNNDALASVSYAEVLAQEVTITAGAHVGKLYLRTANAGAIGNAVTIGAGVIVGAPTGGEKGIGTLNAVELYRNGTVLSAFSTSTDLANATGTLAEARVASKSLSFVKMYAEKSAVISADQNIGAQYLHRVNLPGANVILALPTAASSVDRVLMILVVGNVSGPNLSVHPQTGETINALAASANYTLVNPAVGTRLFVFCDGTQWWITKMVP